MKCLFCRIEAGSRQPFYYIKTSGARGGPQQQVGNTLRKNKLAIRQVSFI